MELLLSNTKASVTVMATVFHHVLALVDEALEERRYLGKVSEIIDEMGAHAVPVRPIIRSAFLRGYAIYRDSDPGSNSQDDWPRVVSAARVVYETLSAPLTSVGHLEIQSNNGRSVTFSAPVIRPEERAYQEIEGYATAHDVVYSTRVVMQHSRAIQVMMEVLRDEGDAE